MPENVVRGPEFIPAFFLYLYKTLVNNLKLKIYVLN